MNYIRKNTQIRKGSYSYMGKCKVSVIVPVYNVEDYIDECIESISNQTFSSIEILLIIGQSTDNSTLKCKEWRQKDNRIRLIDEEEPGLGAARNQGIREAVGEYIVFVDSDDTIKSTYVEKMYHKIVDDSADLVECDFSKIKSYSEEREYNSCTKILQKELDIFEKLLLGNVTMWKIMSKKELWLNSNIAQPFGVAEDMATYPILLFSAKKVVNVSEDLYLYRKDRPGNLCIDTARRSVQIANSMDRFLKECIRRNYFDKYEKQLSIYIRRWISRYSSQCLGRIDEEKYIKIKYEYIEMYNRFFLDKSFVGEMIFGGFNLNRIVNKLQIFEDPYCRVNFTSLISIVSKKKKKYKVKHKNKYREFMLQREYQEDFFELICRMKPKYFFFDLLEERHDILDVNDMFFTKSDAFEEAEIDLGDEIRMIERESSECQKLWEDSCILFFQKLQTYVASQNIIMIKNYLMEQYGDGEKIFYFDNLNKIKKINSLLKRYYQFIENRFPDIQVVELNPDEQYYYTDANYEFGCYPWHLNEWKNIEIAKKIRL